MLRVEWGLDQKLEVLLCLLMTIHTEEVEKAKEISILDHHGVGKPKVGKLLEERSGLLYLQSGKLNSF